MCARRGGTWPQLYTWITKHTIGHQDQIQSYQSEHDLSNMTMSLPLAVLSARRPPYLSNKQRFADFVSVVVRRNLLVEFVVVLHVAHTQLQ
jgi:hypothetical protein